MATKKNVAGSNNKPAAFDPEKLTREQMESVVERYLGYHPDFFTYEGLQIKIKFSRYEAVQREIARKTGKPRVCFTGWRPHKEKWEKRW